MKIDDEERELWVMNDETLYDCWQASDRTIKSWICRNRRFIDNHIKRTLNRDPAS